MLRVTTCRTKTIPETSVVTTKIRRRLPWEPCRGNGSKGTQSSWQDASRNDLSGNFTYIFPFRWTSVARYHRVDVGSISFLRHAFLSQPGHAHPGDLSCDADYLGHFHSRAPEGYDPLRVVRAHLTFEPVGRKRRNPRGVSKGILERFPGKRLEKRRELG